MKLSEKIGLQGLMDDGIDIPGMYELDEDDLASVAQLEMENERLRKAMTRNGQLSVVHLLAWADAIKTENGYSGGNLEVYLRELVVALLEGKDSE